MDPRDLQNQGGLHSKFPIFAIFLDVHKTSPNTDHDIICMFLKRKTI